jgi:hypothetical protein
MSRATFCRISSNSPIFLSKSSLINLSHH